MQHKLLLLFTILIFVIQACTKEPPIPEPTEDTGKITFEFKHYVDGLPLIKDSMIYINAVGNHYEVNQVMYFISDVTLHKNGGTTKLIDGWKDINYVDIEIPTTLEWQVYDDIAVGDYDKITLTFGINQAKNISMMFVNPPEINMMWPSILGGGYHYMMLNGKWKDTADMVQNFAFHMGIGQLYHSNAIDNTDSIYAFVQNYFEVDLPNSSFTIEKNNTRHIELIMNIDSWFKTPHNYNHDYWGGGIMQNQPAMQMAKENGFDVFTVGNIY